MSLILDALNRSRQEGETVPTLASQHGASQTEKPREGAVGILQWSLVIGLSLAVIIIGWLLFDRTQPPTGQDTIEARAPQVELATTAERTATPSPGIVVPESVVATIRSEEAQVPMQSQTSEPPPRETETPVTNRRESNATSASAAAKRQVEDPPVDPSVAALYEQTAPQPTPQSAPRPVAKAAEPAAVLPSQTESNIDIEALVAQAQAELANAELEDIGVPFLVALSQQTKDEIPSIMYQRHDYSGNPSQSSIVLNGQALRTGQSANGLKVIEILPDSSVLEFRGTQFRLRALNSWVNL
ncbi:MAG: general secretion pathway protein GspB [Pseudomonadota bacterium]